MVVSVVYVLQLTLVFIKPARHCHSNPAIDAAVVANLALVAATVVGALLEGEAGPAWTASHVRRSHEACGAPWQWAVASAQTHTLHSQESGPMKVVPLPALVRI